MQIFLQYCYSTILKLYCNSILKRKKKKLFTFSPRNFSLLYFIILVLFSLFLLCFLHLLSPLFRPKHHSPPNINLTQYSGSFFLVGYGLWFRGVRCCWVLLVVGDHQCLGPVLLGFWVAQIGDGFGGDRHGSQRGQCFWVSVGESSVAWFLLWRWVFFIIWVFVSVRFWWAVDSGGVAGMVEAQWQRLKEGGEENWEKRKKEKYILFM